MGYLPYLPQDAASAGDEHTEGTVEVINADLAELLRLPASQFWQVVQKDKSLQTCLDSYLQFARRAHDDSTPGSAPPSDAQQQLAKRVFLVFLRMVTTSEQQAGGLAQQAQAELLYQRWLLDVPKLLDLAVLYGRDNPDLADEAPLGVATGLADGLAYLRDACTTLLAFAEAYPPAARMLLHGGAGLLGVLAALHEELLPLLRSAATRLADVSATRPAAAQMPAQLHQLQIGLQSLAHVLLLHAYLQPAAPMPPEQGKARRPDGRISGDALMAAVMAAQHAGTAGATGGLLRAANERFGTADAFSAALSQGTVVLDPVQRDYCLVALGAATDSAAAQRTAGETSTSQAGVADEALAAKLRQIKELLPDYGDGFLAACLDVYNKDPEQVINHLLEGSLHHDLASLDTMMPLKARQSAAQQAAGKGKGKAPAAENGAAEVSWLNTPAQANGRTAGAPSTSGAGAAATAAAGRKAHKGTSRFLQRTEQDKAAIRMHADAAQWEYEDEYDDSYDDLLANGADGVADVEGDDEYGPSRRGRGFHEDSSPGPRGAGRGSHAHKDKHKAAIGNHHRKDRALKKMGGPAG
ncbi:hypothetical protein WJX72_000683 [[Myrmecia] bisecta]|uniref:CUE domain-containing protein n=1 Tax=[Myrmecia] bisecta TaxID=41462 RepID=A0AAW1QE30_9CHLO